MINPAASACAASHANASLPSVMWFATSWSSSFAVHAVSVVDVRKQAVGIDNEPDPKEKQSGAS